MDTRERLLEAGRFLFWERGYAATSLSDILGRAKARSGSFYHFFASKQDLLNAVLDSYVEALYPVVIGPAVQSKTNGIDRVFAVLGRYRESLRATKCTYGCPIGRLALEIDPANKESMDRIARNFGAWTEAIERLLRQDSAGFPAGTDYPALAQFVLTVMEGAVMQSRAHRSMKPFDTSVEQLRLHLNLLTSGAATVPRARR